MIKLSKRLLKIAEMVPSGTILADIGTDHGYLPIYLIEHQIARKVYACDVNPEPLQSAIDHIKQFHISNIECLLGSGLIPIEDKYVDVVTLSGMGGTLISSILQDSIDYINIRKPILIIQPNVGAAAVRRFLHQINYEIMQEQLVFEKGKFYPIIKAQACLLQVEYNDLELLFGPILLYSKDMIVHDYFDEWIHKQAKIIERVTDLTKKEKQVQQLKQLMLIRDQNHTQ